MDVGKDTGEAASADQDETKAARSAGLVRAMRAHWRSEADAAARGDEGVAKREKDRGDRLFDELITELKGPLARRANDFLHDARLVEDGVREVILMLYTKLRDLSGSASANGW